MNRIAPWLTCIAALVLATPAFGADSSDCESVLDIAASPLDGAVGVPLNPILALADQVHLNQIGPQPPDEDVVVVDPTGHEITAPFSWLTSNCVTVHTPSEVLLADTEYEVRSGSEHFTSFSTGSAQDVTAPEFELGLDDPSEGVLAPFTASYDVIPITGQFGIEDGTRGVGLSPPANGLIDLEEDERIPDGTTLVLTAHDWSGNTASAELIVVSPVGAGGDDDDDDDATDCGCTAGSRPSLRAVAAALVLCVALSIAARRR